MTTKPIDILLEMVSAAGKRGLPLTFALRQVEERLKSEGHNNPTEAAETAIHEALKSYAVDKIIDEPESEEESPNLRPVWLLRIPSSQESSALQELPLVEKALLNLLRESEWDGSIGVMKESVALEKLREQGFDTEYVPSILGRTSTCVRIVNGERVICSHLLSEYERSDDFRAAQKELEEIAEGQAHMLDVRIDAVIRHEEAREKRKAVRKKKTTAAKRKTSTRKKSE